MKILFSIILLFATLSANANECLNLQKALKGNPLWEAPSDNYIGYGFFPEYQYDEEKEDFFYDLNDKGLKINRILQAASTKKYLIEWMKEKYILVFCQVQKEM